ncbi:helix-turn-helix domain-containing protein [Virgibacillus sp. L01]|uniref:helix-turn-helix domain-containing protein n=1 Tax=Virgibacillus sp. L01 TaxID=3457429 RepID=UPI003FD470A3
MQTYETLSIDNVQQYQTFENKYEMNEIIYQYIDVLRNDEQPTSVIEVLRFFGRSSLRVKGVSFAKYETIANSIGKSKRTVIRAINKLAGYGMIERIETVKKWRKSVNIIVIQARLSPQGVTTAEGDQATPDKVEGVEKETEPLVFNQFKNNYILETAKAVKNTIPSPVYDVLSPFFNAKDLRRITGVIFRAKAHPQVKLRIEDHAEEFSDVLTDCIRRFKLGEVSNLDGYIYTSIRKTCRMLYLNLINPY